MPQMILKTNTRQQYMYSNYSYAVVDLDQGLTVTIMDRLKSFHNDDRRERFSYLEETAYLDDNIKFFPYVGSPGELLDKARWCKFALNQIPVDIPKDIFVPLHPVQMVINQDGLYWRLAPYMHRSWLETPKIPWLIIGRINKYHAQKIQGLTTIELDIRGRVITGPCCKPTYLVRFPGQCQCITNPQRPTHYYKKKNDKGEEWLFGACSECRPRNGKRVYRMPKGNVY